MLIVIGLVAVCILALVASAGLLFAAVLLVRLAYDFGITGIRQASRSFFLEDGWRRAASAAAVGARRAAAATSRGARFAGIAITRWGRIAGAEIARISKQMWIVTRRSTQRARAAVAQHRAAPPVLSDVPPATDGTGPIPTVATGTGT
ncbi:hypothetical protein [Microbacterium amylolyticum]|uniref:Uncharacterized protein n=1 Tax=Microbacterium amylolyticum TaxID=936337 RepID=A0ABS4ZEG7_9MICO|nr:hypothetical protein [Microbacterium amylolyticum]MBP2435680.1 hypothetical protein [Microbacterium amylolyticum]